MENEKIESIIIDAVRKGKTNILIENPDVKNFLLKIPIKKAMYWAAKIDNNFDIWNLVLVERRVSCKQILECAEKYHHSLVWAITLGRADVQKELLKMSISEALAYAEKSGKEGVWEFTLTRPDIQKYLENFSESQRGDYVARINLYALRDFFYQKCTVCGKPTTNNPFYAGDTPICGQKCLTEWDDYHSNLDRED